MRMAVACAAAAGMLLAGCGEKDEPAVAPPEPQARQDEPAPSGDDAGDRERPGRNDGESGGSMDAAAVREREAERTARAYIAAIDDRDGARVCRLLAPGALEGLELPRSRGSCAASLDASIGYRDPRGLPQFEAVRVSGPPRARAGATRARVTVPIVTDFADRELPSIEDDVIYLTRAGGAYRVAQASAALYRAVGIADIPPRVISPP